MCFLTLPTLASSSRFDFPGGHHSARNHDSNTFAAGHHATRDHDQNVSPSLAGHLSSKGAKQRRSRH